MLTYKLDPRFNETDGLRHINHSIVPGWFEQARTPIFQLFNPNLTFEKWNLILKKIEVDYLKQIFVGEEVEIKTWIGEIGNTSFTVLHEAWQKGSVVSRGSAVLVHFDYKNEIKLPIPEKLLEKLTDLKN